MNRRQKIIVSVVGIFIVLLALVGLTYGYFLTRIQGNTNTRSITVTTADLKLIYDDGSDGVIGDELVEPSDTVYTKTFTVYNDGNVNIDYGVFLIDVINTFERKDDIKYSISCDSDGATCNGTSNVTFPSGIASVVENTIEPQKTHTYTFSFSYKDTGTDQSVDMGKTLQAKIQIFGKNGNGIIIPYNADSLAFSVLNNGADITVTNPGEFDPNNQCGASDLDTCLSYRTQGCPYSCVIQGTESSETKNDVNIKTTPDFNTVATGESWNEETKSYTNDGLFIAEDDYANSYYFRGPVSNNYVNFAGMCWRIVRIEGDGSTKLILYDQDDLCEESDGNWDIPTETGGSTNVGNFGYSIKEYDSGQLDYNSNPIKYISIQFDYLNGDETSMVNAFKNFQTSSLASKTSSLKFGNWCINDIAYPEGTTDLETTTPINKQTYYENNIKFDYESYIRLSQLNKYNPILKCNGSILNKYNDNTDMYVSGITADELVMAGAKYMSNTSSDENRVFYLMDGFLQSSTSILWYGFFTITPYAKSAASSYSYDNLFALHQSGGVSGSQLNDTGIPGGFFRPVVSLKSNIPISDGIGTKIDPYDVN